MKLALTIHDERTKTVLYREAETEEYVRTDVALAGSNSVVADTLRAVANELDPPQLNAAKPNYALGGIVR